MIGLWKNWDCLDKFEDKKTKRRNLN